MRSENNQKSKAGKPREVFYVWNYLEWGGAQVYFLGIASRIKDKTRVRFVFPKETSRQFINFCDNLALDYEFLDAAADWKPAPTIKRKLERHWNKIVDELNLLRFLSRYDFSGSVVHIDLSPWQSVFALWRLCRRAEQVFMTMHNALPEVSKWRFLLWKLKFALITRRDNFHIFPSNADAKNSLRPFVSERFLERSVVTYTNVNPDEVEEALNAKIDRAEALKTFGLPEDKFLVFCLGQFIDRKGRWVFLEAAKKMTEKHRDVAFVWISNSVLTAEERAKIESYDLDGRFFLIKSEDVGAQHIDLLKFLRHADVYTLPSFVEGLPISLLEAMALGVPSVSTAVYAIPEAVRNNETGLLVAPGDAGGLAAAIEALKADEILRKKLGRNGREHVLANFNEKRVAEIAFKHYRESFAIGAD